MGATIDADALTYIDVSDDRWGSFVQSENLDAFLATYVGEAQMELMKEQMIEQMALQGVEDYEPSMSQMRRALFSEQAAQEYGGSTPDMTDKEMVETNQSLLDKVGILVGVFDEVSDPTARRDGVEQEVAAAAKPNAPEATEVRGTGYFGTVTGTDIAMAEMNKM